jgi:hypothetical protein
MEGYLRRLNVQKASIFGLFWGREKIFEGLLRMEENYENCSGG